MPGHVASILKLDVPVIVVLGARELRLREVTALVPGAIIELAKAADEELELMVNNKVIATGRAVKVGENFGIRVAFVGDVLTRVHALGGATPSAAGAQAGSTESIAVVPQGSQPAAGS
jgi:flagellar motor switch protein FliN/FliY